MPLHPYTRARRAHFVLVLAMLTAGCAPIHTVVRHPSVERTLAPNDGIVWFGPVTPGDESALVRWRDAVGPPVIEDGDAGVQEVADQITVVSWNIANGGGDVMALARTLPPGRPLVMLLQEAYRAGPEVPSRLKPHASFAGRLGGAEA